MDKQDLKNRIEQIDEQQFVAAFDQFKSGNSALMDGYMNADAEFFTLRAARMSYFAAIKCAHKGNNELAMQCLFEGIKCLVFPEKTIGAGTPFAYFEDATIFEDNGGGNECAGCSDPLKTPGFYSEIGQICKDCLHIEIIENEDKP